MPTLQESFSQPSLGPISVPSFSVKEITIKPYHYDTKPEPGEETPEPGGGFHLVAIGNGNQEHILASYGKKANENGGLDQKIKAAQLELIHH